DGQLPQLATVATFGSRRKAASWAAVASPTSTSTSADRVARSKRSSEVCVRRAPAAAPSTAAPAIPTTEHDEAPPVPPHRRPRQHDDRGHDGRPLTAPLTQAPRPWARVLPRLPPGRTPGGHEYTDLSNLRS